MHEIPPQIKFFVDKDFTLFIFKSKKKSYYLAKIYKKGSGKEVARGETPEKAIAELENKLTKVAATNFVI